MHLYAYMRYVGSIPIIIHYSQGYVTVTHTTINIWMHIYVYMCGAWLFTVLNSIGMIPI